MDLFERNRRELQSAKYRISFLERWLEVYETILKERLEYTDEALDELRQKLSADMLKEHTQAHECKTVI